MPDVTQLAPVLYLFVSKGTNVEIFMFNELSFLST